MSNEFDVPLFGPRLLAHKTGLWAHSNDITAAAVVFVHGFTAHGGYFRDFADSVKKQGFCPLILDYDSHLGIDKGSEDLIELLSQLMPGLQTHGFFMVAHSMGGLVARCAIQNAPPELRGALLGLVTLGTPHCGAFNGRRLVSALLDAGELLASPHPLSRTANCRATRQLTMSDGERLVERLALHEMGKGLGCPILSVSGGLQFLEFSRTKRRTLHAAIRNALLQIMIHKKPNDGLVAESSSDYSLAIVGPGSTHHRSYRSWERTNHTGLACNQFVAHLVINWLESHRP